MERLTTAALGETTVLTDRTPSPDCLALARMVAHALDVRDVLDSTGEWHLRHEWNVIRRKLQATVDALLAGQGKK
jgi:hypothetical protein